MEHCPINTRLSNFLELVRKSGIDLREPDIIYNSGPRHGPVWGTIFVLSCAVGFFVDPLFLYIWNINDDLKCFRADKKLQTAILVLRSLVDFCYFADYVVRTWSWSGYSAYKVSRANRLWNFIRAINIAFPYPQVTLFEFPTFSIILPFLHQYGVRVSLVYSWATRINIETKIKRMIKGVLCFLPFILAAHVFGAMWYYLALSREMKCWKKVVYGIKGRTAIIYNLTCGPNNWLTRNNITITDVNEYCPTNPSKSNATLLDFGIYNNVIESGMSTATHSGSKLLQCFWWGLRNLSSFGSNLQPSSDAWENIFGIAISIIGILIFLIFLTQNLQTFRQLGEEISKNRAVKQKMKMINPEIDLWLSKNPDVPRDMKTVIKESVRSRVEENKDVDVEDIFSILPSTHKRLIMRPLCLALLNKVQMLQNRDGKVLQEMCEHLKPVMYVEDTCIIREGEPLQKMFFITQGTALTYTTRTNTNLGESTSGSSMIDCLQKDDFYGAELLSWAFNFAFFSDLPISTRTVICQEKVQAFVIRAKDLRIVVSKFWWHFCSQLGDMEDSQSKQLQHFAAFTIQAACRRRKARARGGTHWDTVMDINAFELLPLRH